MKQLFRLGRACCLSLSFWLLGFGAASAQTTDGYSAIQVFPVVVDTASFTQRFNFRNPNAALITIQPTYFPATGTSQATALTCPTFTIGAFGTTTIASLRTMCPGLPPTGGQFGFLHTMISGGGLTTYAGFSRVANPQGNGFSVEAFSARQFTAADSVVNGIRRMAATISSPTFQTNCFLGIINNVDGSSNSNNANIHYTITSSAGAALGAGDQLLAPGKMVRLLDVFAAGGVVGDHDNAQIRFQEQGPDEPGVIAFCTVQDNTSFGADFRIAKQELADDDNAYPGLRTIGPQNNSATSREILVGQDKVGRPFQISAGNSSNTHVVYLDHADYAQCEIINPSTGLRALPNYGLEIRVVADDLVTTDAGGNNSTVIPDPGQGQPTYGYLGDRTQDSFGVQSRTLIEVESNEQNTGAIRPYKLHCRTGSGSTLVDIIRYQEVVDRF